MSSLRQLKAWTLRPFSACFWISKQLDPYLYLIKYWWNYKNLHDELELPRDPCECFFFFFFSFLCSTPFFAGDFFSATTGLTCGVILVSFAVELCGFWGELWSVIAAWVLGPQPIFKITFWVNCFTRWFLLESTSESISALACLQNYQTITLFKIPALITRKQFCGFEMPRFCSPSVEY